MKILGVLGCVMLVFNLTAPPVQSAAAATKDCDEALVRSITQSISSSGVKLLGLVCHTGEWESGMSSTEVATRSRSYEEGVRGKCVAMGGRWTGLPWVTSADGTLGQKSRCENVIDGATFALLFVTNYHVKTGQYITYAARVSKGN